MSSKQKDLGQVWTPDWIIEKILDEVGFSGSRLLGKKILEPSFGAGFFFQHIIKRIVHESRKKGYTVEKTVQLIDDNVYGIEFDTIFRETVAGLKKWAYETYGLHIVLPYLFNQDALDYVEGFGQFDFVVGNPPYVRIHNLPLTMREKIKQYSHSSGTPDLYLIFYELGLKWLNQSGVLGYIAPNSWTRNASPHKFRKEIVDNQYLKTIIDFGNVNVFPQISAYTNLVVLDKKGSTEVTYVSMKTETEVDFSTVVSSSFLRKSSGSPLVFVPDKDFMFLSHHKNAAENEKLNSICKIQNALSTLGDKMFVLPDNFSTDNLIYTRSAVKASTYKGGAYERMVFPYELVEGKYVGVGEDKFLSEVPELFAYLYQFKDKLASRSLDKGSLWFWYGRSQAIQETNKRKLVVTPVVNSNLNTVETFIVPEGTLVYSGLFITETDPCFPLECIQEMLAETSFLEYCKLLGKDMSGGYKNISAPLLKNYNFNKNG